jgi:molybdopterin synthase sulfur carrier subunit
MPCFYFTPQAVRRYDAGHMCPSMLQGRGMHFINQGKSGILLFMNVTVRLFASLRQFGPDEQVSAFPEGTTIDDVIQTLHVPGTIRILRIVNGEHRPADHVLKDGDELALFPPIAGGASPRLRVSLLRVSASPRHFFVMQLRPLWPGRY